MYWGGVRHKSAWAGELVRRFLERCARREALRDDEDLEDLDWNRLPNGHLLLPVREGSLLAYLVDAERGRWTLHMQWSGHPGLRYLTSGSRSAIERLARRIQQVGPPGGPASAVPGPRWRDDEDGTEHAVTVGGELRLMPPVVDDGDGVLLLAHNDHVGSVSVLGVGAHDELQGDDDELVEHIGVRVRLSIGGRSRHLQVIGADGIVGYLDLGDDLFILGHLGGDVFGLACQSGDIRRAIRTYSAHEVMRGDLGSVEDWAAASPPRRATRVQAARRRSTQPDAERGRQTSTATPRTPDRLTDRDLESVRHHLTPESDWTGEASSVIPKILEALRVAVQLEGIGNKISFATGLLRWFAAETGVEIHCCAKILNIALHRIALATKLVVPLGRRWKLRLGDVRVPDRELLQWMIKEGPLRERKPTRRGRAWIHKKSARPRTRPAATSGASPADTPPAPSSPTPPSPAPPSPAEPAAPSSPTTPSPAPPPPSQPAASPSPPENPTTASPPGDAAASSPASDVAAPSVDPAPSAPAQSASTPPEEPTSPAEPAAPSSPTTPSPAPPPPSRPAASPSPPENPTTASPPGDAAASSPASDVAAPSVDPAPSAPSTESTAESAQSASTPPEEPTPAASSDSPPCAVDEWVCDPSDSQPMVSVGGCVLAEAPMEPMTPPPPSVHRPPRRGPARVPPELAAMGLVSFEQLAAMGPGILSGAQQQGGMHLGNTAIQGDAFGTDELRSPGGWRRPNRGKRPIRPP